MQRFLDILLGLERVSMREWSHLRFAFAVNWPGVVIFLVCAGLIALGYWSYRKQSAAPAKRRAMGIIRGFMLAVVFLLLCRPQLVLDFDEKTPSVVAVCIDNSASATIEDPYTDQAMRDLVRAASAEGKLDGEAVRANRFHLALHSLKSSKWLRDVVEQQTVMIFAGSTGVERPVGTIEALREGQKIQDKQREIEAVIDGLKQIRAKDYGDATDIPALVGDIGNYVVKNGRTLSAIVLLTDGQSTQGGRNDLAAAGAARGNTKLFSLPLGQATSPLNLKLSAFQSPENSFVRDPVAVKSKLEWTGLDRPATVRVSLLRQQAGGSEQPLIQREFDLPKGDGSKNVELIFKPEKKSAAEKSEKFSLLLKVEPVTPLGGEELTTKDNQLAGTLNVLDAEVNVLYVEGYPRWEYRYLKNEYIREKSVNVSSLLLSADENFAQEGDPRKVDKDGRETFPGPITRFPETEEEISKYDVILIGDVEPSYFSPTQMRLLVEHVRKRGAGVGWIAGAAHNPESYRGTPLEVLLPVIPDDPVARALQRPENAPFNLVLTAEGKNSNLFRFFDEPEKNVKQIGELPEFYWFKPVLGRKPATEVLAVHPTRTQAGEPAPLLVIGRYGEGRVLFSAYADTWRWRRYVGEPLYQSYWLQMARLLYRNRAMAQSNRRVEMYAEAPIVEVGKQATITLEIKDPTLTGQITQGQIPVKLVNKQDGTPVDSLVLTRTATPEKFEGKVTLRETGQLQARIDPGIVPVEVAPLELTVDPPGREFERLTADLDALGVLASRTGGAVVPLPQADTLAAKIPDQSLPILTQRSEELWVKPIALILVLALLTAEWLVRKSAGLI